MTDERIQTHWICPKCRQGAKKAHVCEPMRSVPHELEFGGADNTCVSCGILDKYQTHEEACPVGNLCHYIRYVLT